MFSHPKSDRIAHFNRRIISFFTLAKNGYFPYTISYPSVLFVSANLNNSIIG